MEGSALITESAPTEPARLPRTVDPRNEYTCECGHLLYVYGGGRHRVYFPPENDAMDDPIMNGVCPECGRGLPGKQ